MFTESSLQTSDKIAEETHYYPFGLTLFRQNVSSNENKYQYNSKELIDEAGLDWYHYGARYYDPQVGRWWVVDPVDEQFSSYAYCINNPLKAVDPDGSVILFINGFDPKHRRGRKSYWGDEFVEGAKNILGEADNKSVFIDGSPFSDGYTALTAYGGNPVSVLKFTLGIMPSFRFDQGKEHGQKNAAEYIQMAVNDGTGTIKLVTHSMDAAYGRGVVAGLQRFFNENPDLVQGVAISIVVDFCPHLGEQLPANVGVETFHSLEENKLWAITIHGGVSEPSGSIDIGTTPGTEHNISTHDPSIIGNVLNNDEN